MKKILCILALSLPLLSVASTSNSNQIPTNPVDLRLEKLNILYEQNGIKVFGENYSHEGKTYLNLKFVNTTKEAIRFLWSVKVKGEDFPVNMDGTTQAYLTIPAGEAIYFGQFNSEDPLIEIDSVDFEKEINIHIEIQESL